MNGEREFITPKQAIEMLPDGEFIHTFRNPRGILVGADWSRQDILEAIHKAGKENLEIGVEQCQRMNHGLVLWEGNDPLFIATKYKDTP